ncbi:MAG: Periplasmic solute binding protein [Verrucomicrobiales bacterium]|nr:Periplasmic solute binding protein [Verrucomicrobiales bacterium]
MKHTLSLLLLLATTLAASAKLNVIATTADFGSLAKEIGGDKIDLTILAKPTEDAHFVDAKPSFIVKLSKADAIVEGGAELELGWLPPLMDGSRNSKIENGKPGHIACAEGISLLEVPSTLDRSKGDIHAAGNPHFMTDPANARIVAAHLAKAFSQLDPKSATTFQANLAAFQTHLDAKIIDWKKQLAPYKGRTVVSYHNSWPYFARAFDLRMDLYLEPKPGIPPSPAHLVEVITKMKEQNANVIIVEPYLNRKTAESIANRTGAAVLDFPGFPWAPKTGDGSYIEWMDYLVNTLARGFEIKH